MSMDQYEIERQLRALVRVVHGLPSGSHRVRFVGGCVDGREGEWRDLPAIWHRAWHEPGGAPRGSYDDYDRDDAPDESGCWVYRYRSTHPALNTTIKPHIGDP